MNFLLIATIMSVEITGKNEDRVSGATEESFGRDRHKEKGLRRNSAGLEMNGSPGLRFFSNQDNHYINSGV